MNLKYTYIHLLHIYYTHIYIIHINIKLFNERENKSVKVQTGKTGESYTDVLYANFANFCKFEIILQ